MKNSNLVLELPKNTNGRDYFVGDIHGYLSILESCLDKLGFNEQTDRLIAVGDLIDRGPDSLSCLRLMHKKWFYSCRGNHEQMFSSKQIEKSKKFNISNFWQSNLTRIEIQECLDIISSMPIAISIRDDNSHIGIVHAGVPFNHSWNSFISRIKMKDEKIIQHALFDRNIHHLSQTIEGAKYIFSGHQGLEEVSFFGNQICIDTAVFLKNWPGENYGLSISWVENQKPVFIKKSQ